MFYGADCGAAYIVPVAMAQYTPVPSHIDFVGVEYWLSMGSLHANCINQDEKRFPLTKIPGSSCDLKFCYTFHVKSQVTTSHSINNLLVNRFSRGKQNWKGDVLVVKSTLEAPDIPVNMDITDLELVNLLLIR